MTLNASNEMRAVENNVTLDDLFFLTSLVVRPAPYVPGECTLHYLMWLNVAFFSLFAIVVFVCLLVLVVYG